MECATTRRTEVAHAHGRDSLERRCGAIGWALAHRGSTLAQVWPRSGPFARNHKQLLAHSAKIRLMLRRLLTLLLMLCLATGAAARGCPMAAAAPNDTATAMAGAAAHTAMPDCPHAKAAGLTQTTADDSERQSTGLGKTGCDHCKQCRVQVPPVELLSLQPLLPPAQVPDVETPAPPSLFNAPNLRPPISSRPAHHA